jgi:hypothetical protein
MAGSWLDYAPGDRARHASQKAHERQQDCIQSPSLDIATRDGRGSNGPHCGVSLSLPCVRSLTQYDASQGTPYVLV